jgi:hypothetical protein
MKFTKPDLHLLALCISALVLFAVGGARVFHSSNDFVPVYTGARCLLHGCNPYDTSQLEQQFYQAGGHPGELPSWLIDVPVYPPSTFLVLSPLALLPFPAARLLWFLLSGGLLVTAAGLTLSVNPPPHRWLATALVSFFLVTAGILLVLGQPAVFAISLVVIGSCLFLQGRLLPLGTLYFYSALPSSRKSAALLCPISWCRKSIGATRRSPWPARVRFSFAPACFSVIIRKVPTGPPLCARTPPRP